MTTLELPGYVHLYSGKVRELYSPVGADGQPRQDQVLLVASDRMSAFDFILTSEIPDKGAVLTQMSLWWFERLADIVPNHVVSTEVPAEVAGRAVLVERLDMAPVECIARAYLTGHGLAEYVESGSASGVALPPGLVDGSKLPEPIFTPSTKAAVGEHDELISYDAAAALVGADRAEQLSELTRRILARGNEIAASRGILIADTKVEFGTRPSGELVLADEVLTPDSSRFWPAADWEPGRAQASYDKQFVRDWLTSPASEWDKASGEEPPALPEEVIEKTRAKYIEAYETLTGHTF